MTTISQLYYITNSPNSTVKNKTQAIQLEKGKNISTNIALKRLSKIREMYMKRYSIILTFGEAQI